MLPAIEKIRNGVTKRCRLSWLTNRALVTEPQRGGRRRGGVAGSQQQYSLFQFSQPVFSGSVTAASYAAICTAKLFSLPSLFLTHLQQGENLEETPGEPGGGFQSHQTQSQISQEGGRETRGGGGGEWEGENKGNVVVYVQDF
jgi:hypothetical protein